MKKYISYFSFAILISFFLTSCEKESITDEVSLIGKNEGSTSGSYLKTETLDEAAIAEINAKADAEFMNFKNVGVQYKSTIPHWVGVIANSTSCPAGVAEIRYYMDCEDKNPATKYSYNGSNDFKPEGLSVDDRKNIYWVVCIVDAKQHNFYPIKKGFAIFDLSSLTNLNNTSEVCIHSDDEDTDNKNRYDSQNVGFSRSLGPTNTPFQTGSYNNSNGWTEFWLYYFTAQDTPWKLPDLGFEYSVLSQFDCCNWTNQNILEIDTEDNDPSNTMRIYPEFGNAYSASSIDDTYHIAEVGKNIKLFIQNSATYRW